ncbi:MAG: polysaccharide deacetylase family protein [Solirubrobacteraceae bacterium]
MSGALVLCYHAVSPRWTAALSVTQAALERQLASLVRRGYRGVSFRDAALEPGGAMRVAVTFDDAFASVFELARPVLDALGLPGTVFVPTSYIGSGRSLRWEGIGHWEQTEHAAELACMDWEQVGALADAGWEIGSHTLTHPHLTRLDGGDLERELRESRAALQARLGRRCETLAYPYGDVDERVVRTARRAGYSAGAALSSSLNFAGELRYPRVGIYHGDSSARYALKVSPLMRRFRASRAWPR